MISAMVGATIVILQATFCFLTSSSNKENSSDDDHNHNDESSLKKGPWTTEEDEILAAYVTEHGPGNWNIVKKNTGLARCGKSCRLRWTNHLRPDLKRCAFSNEEQQKIFQLHASLGNKWARMAQELPGRTDNEIKNFWNTRLKKRKRAGLPIYPDGLKPSMNIDNSDSSLNDSSNNSPPNPSYNVPELVFNNYKLSQNEDDENFPFHVQPNDQYASSSSSTPSSTLKPTITYSHDEVILRENPPLEAKFYQRTSSHDEVILIENPPLETKFYQGTSSLDELILRENPPQPKFYQGTSSHDEVILRENPPLEAKFYQTTSLHDEVILRENPPPLEAKFYQTTSLHDEVILRENPPPLEAKFYQTTSSHDEVILRENPPLETKFYQGTSSHDEVILRENPPLETKFHQGTSSHDEVILRENPPLETKFYQRTSPRSNGYLESIFYPPKILEGSSNSENSEKLENFEFVNQDYMQNLSGWFENHDDKYQYDNNDTLFKVIGPYIHKNKNTHP